MRQLERFPLECAPCLSSPITYWVGPIWAACISLELVMQASCQRWSKDLIWWRELETKTRLRLPSSGT